MAKAGWSADNETLNAAPASSVLSPLGDGSSALADWKVVTAASGHSGQSMKLVGASSSYLSLDGVSSYNGSTSLRVDVRGKAYRPGKSSAALPFCYIRAKYDSGKYMYYCDISGSSNLRVNGFNTAYTSVGTNYIGPDFTGWFYFRYTYDPNYGPDENLHRLVLWDDSSSEQSPVLVTTNDNTKTGVDGTEIGLGGTVSTNTSEIAWITVGTDTDDADEAPPVDTSIKLAGAGTVSVSASGDLTATTPPATKGVRVRLYDGQTPLASITGITALWWDAETPSGAPVYETNTAAIDADGWLELNIDAETALDLTDNGHLKLYKAGADAEADLHYSSRLPVVDIA